MILKKAPLLILQDLCFATKKFSNEIERKVGDQSTPLHSAIKAYSDRTGLKAETLLTPLHIAAMTGMFELCR